MSCCGGRRKAHKAWLVSRPVPLRYLGEGPIHVVGPITGKQYSFPTETQEIEVDAHDAPGLIQTRKFLVSSPSLQINHSP